MSVLDLMFVWAASHSSAPLHSSDILSSALHPLPPPSRARLNKWISRQRAPRDGSHQVLYCIVLYCIVLYCIVLQGYGKAISIESCNDVLTLFLHHRTNVWVQASPMFLPPPCVSWPHRMCSSTVHASPMFLSSETELAFDSLHVQKSAVVCLGRMLVSSEGTVWHSYIGRLTRTRNYRYVSLNEVFIAQNCCFYRLPALFINCWFTWIVWNIVSKLYCIVDTDSSHSIMDRLLPQYHGQTPPTVSWTDSSPPTVSWTDSSHSIMDRLLPQYHGQTPPTVSWTDSSHCIMDRLLPQYHGQWSWTTFWFFQTDISNYEYCSCLCPIHSGPWYNIVTTVLTELLKFQKQSWIFNSL